MTKLILTRGAPASGKTTYAKQWVSMAPKRVRINRDDLRFSMYGLYFGDPIDENAVTKVQHAMVVAALKAGNSVIVDDTNLNERFAKKLIALGHRHGAEVEVIDFEVPLKELLRRNEARTLTENRHVPEDVVRKFHSTFSGRKTLDVTPPVIRPYNGTPGKPMAYLFDIDGTLAKMSGRSPYEWHRVGEDTAIDHVVQIAHALASDGYAIVFLSGRDGSCYDITSEWIRDEVMDMAYLFMRTAKDQRPDNIIKAELFDAHVRDRWNVQGVFDDRDQVVDMWRAMGIPCYQVAPGDF